MKQIPISKWREIKIMKTKILLLTLLMATTLIAPVLAKGPTKMAGLDIQQLYLLEKDAAWVPVLGGAWGKMTYNVATGDFVFNGHGLDAGRGYTLINFARIGSVWPAHINELGAGTANGGGNVHIEGTFAYANLEGDTTPATPGVFKIWLVPTLDIDINGDLAGWTPEEYLFEADVI